MEGRKAFLACLLLLCYVSWGRGTKEANPCHPEIPCDDGECIHRDDWCDRFPHCYDETDEKYCKTKSLFSSGDNKCNETLHFVCSNKQCVPKVLVCDGFEDCKDKSDEKNCAESEEDGEQVTEYEERRTTPEPVSRGDVPFPDSLTTQKPISSREHPTRGNGPDPRVTTALFSPHEYDGRGNVPYPDPRATQPPFYPYDYHSRVNVPYPDPRATQAPVSPRGYGRRGNVPNSYPRGLIPEPTLRRAWPLPVFRFQEDRQKSLGRRYSGALFESERWLLKQEVTPRVLVALSLARNSFSPNTTQYEVMRRTLKLQLGSKLFKQPENPVNVHELATYINALLATCQNPRQIYGQDLVSMLQNRTHRTTPSPSVLLTLCLANASVAHQDFGLLQHVVLSPIIDEVSKDRFILSTSALACIHKRGLYANELRSVLSSATRKLLDLQYDDGSFGNIYSTALAAQALFALDTKVWNPDQTLDFVIGHQSADGSFGDMLATYYILPILSGRSLLHLRETQCEKPKEEASPEAADRIFDGRTKTVWYTLATGLDRVTQTVTVPDDANFFEIMQEAQKLHPRFRFLYTETFGKLDVYTLSDVPNDPERGTYWQLFVPDRNGNANRIYDGDIRQLIPRDNEELLYWYLPHRSSFPSAHDHERQIISQNNWL